jgi:hypothetical protein
MPPVIQSCVHHGKVRRWHRWSAPGPSATIMPERQGRSPTSALFRLQPAPRRAGGTRSLAVLRNAKCGWDPKGWSIVEQERYPSLEVVEQAGCNRRNRPADASDQILNRTMTALRNRPRGCFPNRWTNTLSMRSAFRRVKLVHASVSRCPGGGGWRGEHDVTTRLPPRRSGYSVNFD